MMPIVFSSSVEVCKFKGRLKIRGVWREGRSQIAVIVVMDWEIWSRASRSVAKQVKISSK